MSYLVGSSGHLMNMSWVESVSNPTCNQNTNLTVTLLLPSLPWLPIALGKMFILLTMGSSLRPASTTYLPALRPHSSHAKRLAFAFLSCQEPLWQTLIHSLWVSSTVASSNSQSPSPVPSCEAHRSLHSPLLHYSIIVFLPSCLSHQKHEHICKSLAWISTSALPSVPLGQSRFPSLSLSFLICKMGVLIVLTYGTVETKSNDIFSVST